MKNSTSECSVVILDFGSQFTQLIARAVRALGIYCEIHPFSISLSQLKTIQPRALILSGGPSSVRSRSAPRVVKGILEMDIPVLGICYGMQLISQMQQGQVGSGNAREYGFCEIEVLDGKDLFFGFSRGQRVQVWMSHGDNVGIPPSGAIVTARSANCPVVAIQMGKLYAVQFHPEVAHTPIGIQILRNFLFRICGLSQNWKMGDFLQLKKDEIIQAVGKNRVIGAVSGGVDSTVLAVFLGKILGSRFHPVLVDNGLLRRDEAREVKRILHQLGIRLKVLDKSDWFLKKLKGVRDPEKKRKIIGRAFIEVFEEECSRISGVKFLAQGTLYPDVIESVSVKGPSHTIKSHHNVGGLPQKMKLGLIEPFKELFKDEVRELGRSLGISEGIINRHPFPGPGLAVRILGPVDRKKLELLRKADAIFSEELKKQNLYNEIWQSLVVLLPVKAVGVMGDARTYESVVSLRAVTSRDGMTADWYSFEKAALGRIANRIINEVSGINRVVYDISSKPPATIEWE